MADAKIINYGQQISAGTTAIPDNNATALVIQDTAGEQFMKITTTDGAEQLELGVGAGDAGEIKNAGLIIREVDGSLPELQICNEMGFIDDTDTMMRLKTANTIAFKTAGTDRMAIGPTDVEINGKAIITDPSGPSGNVGTVGTSADTLVIDGAHDGGLTIVGETGDPMRIFFVNDDYDQRAGILAKAQGSSGDSSTRYLDFLAGGSSRMIINQDDITIKESTTVIGLGGASGNTAPATGGATPVLALDNGTANSANRCTLYMNSAAAGGSQLDMYQAGDRKLLIMAQASEQTITAEDTLVLKGESGDKTRVTVGATELGIQDLDTTVITNNADDATAKSLIFTRSRSNTDGTAVVVQDDDILGNIEFQGAEDGDSFATGAKIFARVNGTPGDGDMPTELVFATSADGSEAPAERMHIFENGSVGIGDTSNTSKKLAVTGDVRFSANVLGGSFAWVSNSSYKISPGATDSSSKLNGPLAFEVTSDPTGIADCAEIYAKDDGSSAELYTRDEAGNVTQLSPHNFQMFEPDPSYTQPWSYTSRNAYIGKEVGVDMFGLVKAVEELSGKTLMYERDLPDEEVKDWYVEQGRIQAARENAIAEWDASHAAEDGGLSSEQPRPEPYTIKDPPEWLKSRLKLGGD